MIKYNPSKIEKKWQKEWEKKKTHETKDSVTDKDNFMLLFEFPYPSGDLHIGHWFSYVVPDILARYKRMKGYNLMYPIGFDAFGLPAENAAIQRNINPAGWTKKNIIDMSKQLKTMGASFDWSRKVETTDPEYYKWTQWMFLKFYENGLAYRDKTKVNWCPKDKTVLANEQVVDGCCDRCGTKVVQKELTQWMFKITKYADSLYDDIDDLDWPETTKLAQKNWIGRSEGARIKFQLADSKDDIEIFTTRPDTIFGATFMVLAPEHHLVEKITTDDKRKEVKDYLERSKSKTELERLAEVKEKTGVFTGAYAINPANKEKIQIWISDFVLPYYGTGAIMAVPAHDERDFEFAKKFDLPVKQVIEPVYIDTTGPSAIKTGLSFDHRNAIIAIVKHWSDDRYMGLKWKQVAWGTFITGGVEKGQTPEEAAKAEIREETGYLNPKLVKYFGIIHGKFYHPPKKVNRFAHAHTLYFELENGERENTSEEEQKIHDIHWFTHDELEKFLTPSTHHHALRLLADKQGAYIGEGILVNSGQFDGMDSEKAKWEITKFVGGRKEVSYRLHDWILSRQRYWGVPIPMINCRKCGYVPVSEKDLPVKLPPLQDFRPTDEGRSPLAKATKWLRVKCPDCGGEAERETDTMDTFVDSSWYFIRYTDPKNKKVFADKKKMQKWLPVPMYIGGAEHNTMHLLYSRFFTKALYGLGLINFPEPFLARRNHGVILGTDNQKMSKSKGNVVNPDDYVKKYGSDTVRMFLAFMGPYENGGSWDSKAIVGVYRFLNRVWNFITKEYGSDKADKILHKAIKKIGEDIENLRFNTAVSKLMKLLNEIEYLNLTKPQKEIFLKLLAPLAPHLADELWSRLHSRDSAIKQSRIRDSQSESGHQPKNCKSIHLEKWPDYNSELIKEEMIDLVIQVNGKVRDTIKMQSDLSESEVRELVLKSEKIKKYISDKEIKKFIYIPNRLVNIVI